MIDFYNRGGKSLLRGTNWYIILSGLRLVFKRLKVNQSWKTVFFFSVKTITFTTVATYGPSCREIKLVQKKH
jgi:hypothetical protein